MISPRRSGLRRQVQRGVPLGCLPAWLLLHSSGSQLGLVHIGDSRAYLRRDDKVFQITHDHTMVQSLLDDGKITKAEISSHPQRSLLLRALTTDGDGAPDLQLRDAQAGDRYLLCSDGLHGVVDGDSIARVLHTVDTLIRPRGT